MKQFEDWLLQERDRARQFVSLYDMLFAGRIWQYLIFRLRLFNVQVLGRFFLHAIVFYLAYQNFAAAPLLMVVIALTLKLIIANLWWGGLEVLRTQVRYAYRSAHYEEVNKHIGFWLTFSMILASLVFLLTVAVGYMAWSQAQSASPQLYVPWLIITVMFFLLSGQIILRSYHSGIYAITRVIRPGLSMILADLIGLSFLALSWPSLHTLSLPLALLIRGLVSLWLNYHYTSRMYGFYDINPQFSNIRSFSRQFKSVQLLPFILGAIANACAYIDGFLILAWLAIEKWVIFAHELTIPTSLLLIVLIAPLIRAASDWSFLFYFDRKRLDSPELSKFSEQFNNNINRASAAIGFFYWFLSFITCYAFISAQASLDAVILLPFFLMAAKIANLQRRAFAEFRYWDVIVSGLFMAINSAAAYFLTWDMAFRFAWSLITMLLTYRFLRRPHFLPSNRIKPTKQTIGFYRWLQSLYAIKNDELSIYRLYFSRAMKPAQMFTLINRLIHWKLHEQEQICILNNREFIFFLINQRQGHDFDQQRFFEQSAGLLTQISSAHFLAQQLQDKEQRAVYNHKIFSGLFPIGKLEINSMMQPSREQLLVDFLAIFPYACYFTPHYCPGPKAQPLHLDVAREINYLVYQHLNLQETRRDAEIDVSVLYINGVVEVVFVIPLFRNRRHQDPDIKNWHHRLMTLNVYFAMQYQ